MRKMKWFTILTALILAFGCIGIVHAEIIPPVGGGQQIGPPAVVLCEKLTLREKPSTSSKAVLTLQYGDRPLVIEEKDGWAYVATGDSEDSPVGWVNSDYIAINPAWYKTEKKTVVYAWNDTDAPKVAQLDKNTTLPILKEEKNWYVVSLRGAAGWIRK